MAIRAIALFECWCPGWFHTILTFELVYIMFFMQTIPSIFSMTIVELYLTLIFM